jgi:hypothetical protein
MGVHFFPTTYEDELIYSVFGRYHIRSGNPGFNLSLKDIYGGAKGVTPSVELQSNLDILISNLPVGSNITSDNLIQNHTLFPFYAAFVPADRARDSMQIIKNGNLSSVYPKLGIINNRKGNSTSFLWHCEECYKDDVNRYGESYWHRNHQLPGIDVCSYHSKPLSRSYDSVSGKNRQRVIVPLAEEISWEDRYMDTSVFEKKLIISKRATELMNSPYRFNNPDYIKNVYKSRLIDKNLAYGNGLLKKKALKRKIINHWGSELLSELGLLISEDDTNTWVDKIINKGKVIVNPLAHIIICEALQLDLIDLLNYSIPIKDHMTIWEDGIITSALDGLSLRDIAKKNNTTRLTIQKVIERRGIDVKWESNGGLREKYTDTEKFKGFRENKRKEFLSIINDKPDLKVSHFRRDNDNLYSWFQKYDKDWYYKNKKFASSRVNTKLWEERDQKYLPLVQEVVERMKKDYPMRITYNSVGGDLGISTWLYSKNMINTTAYLDSEVEKIDDFWIRRLRWAIAQIENDLIHPYKWDIINLSGISIKKFEKLKEQFSELKNL